MASDSSDFLTARKRSLDNASSEGEPLMKRMCLLDEDEEAVLEGVSNSSSSSQEAMVEAMMRSLEQVIEHSHSEDALSSSSSPSSAVLERHPYPSYSYYNCANDEVASVASSVDDEDVDEGCVTSSLQEHQSPPPQFHITHLDLDCSRNLFESTQSGAGYGNDDANSLIQELLNVSDEQQQQQQQQQHLIGDYSPIDNLYWDFLESAEWLHPECQFGSNF